MSKFDKSLRRASFEVRRLAAAWAADCAERVLVLFERMRPGDDRPRCAIEAARAWSRGDIRPGVAHSAAIEAHRAARACEDPAGRCAARAAGHAAAVAHMADHMPGAASYALKALRAAFGEAAVAAEQSWHREHIPPALRALEDG